MNQLQTKERGRSRAETRNKLGKMEIEKLFGAGNPFLALNASVGMGVI
jgi:hypothetical protein